jgi:hypothetical protein
MKEMQVDIVPAVANVVRRLFELHIGTISIQAPFLGFLPELLENWETTRPSTQFGYSIVGIFELICDLLCV